MSKKKNKGGGFPWVPVFIIGGIGWLWWTNRTPTPPPAPLPGTTYPNAQTGSYTGVVMAGTAGEYYATTLGVLFIPTALTSAVIFYTGGTITGGGTTVPNPPPATFNPGTGPQVIYQNSGPPASIPV
jgi:hypothetical protein